MIHHLDYDKLIDRGRKAGVSTAELYRAIDGCLMKEAVHSPGQTDGNGFVVSYDTHGRAVHHPLNSGPRP